jgi:arylsulfatase A-like enzyme
MIVERMAVLNEVENEKTSRSKQAGLYPVLAFASIAAWFCSSLEITTLEYVDTFRLYMTAWEITLEVGAALVILMMVSVAWWLCILLLGKTVRVFSRMESYSASLCWHLWLAVPFSYFMLELLSAARLRVFPRWHPGVLGSLLSGISLILIWIAGSSFFGQHKVQNFCRTHLSPVGWLHVAAGLVMLIVLLACGVHPYSDFVNSSTLGAGSNLPDVYLITIDALRAQDMSIYGYDRPTTPNLERLARRSFVFDNFVANSNFTTPGTVTIETGKLPWSHRVYQLGGFLHSSVRQNNLAEELRQRGYYTASISSNVLATPFVHNTVASYDAVEYAAPLGLTGLWMRYSNLAGVNGQVMLFYGLLRRLEGMLSGFVDKLIWDHRYPYPAEPIFDRARNLIESHEHTQPLFLWTHILAPHDPYWPPIPYRTHFVSKEKLTQIRASTLPPGISVSELRAEYDEMILYADHAVGDYLDWLDRTGRLDHAIVIITSDHGESFEHDWFQHAGPYLYNGLIRIPLLIHLPGQQQGARIPQLSQQADVLPTILDLVRAQIPSWVDGISLKPLLEGKTVPQRYVFSMTLEGSSVFDCISKGTLAVIDDDFKYLIRMDSEQQELYRYKSDESEEHNLVESDKDVAKRMHDVLLGKLKEENDRLPSSGNR